MPEVAPETTPLPEVTADEILRELNEAGRAGTAAKFSRYVTQQEALRAFYVASLEEQSETLEVLGVALQKQATSESIARVDETELDPEATPPEPGKRKKGGK